MAVRYMIAGAGSAGAVLAARLADDPAAEVLLLEAGPDYPSRAETPAELLDARSVAGTHDWEYLASPVRGRSGAYPRGKVVGGTSSINAALAVGAPRTRSPGRRPSTMRAVRPGSMTSATTIIPAPGTRVVWGRFR